MAWLDNWANRLELTIDHERVDEDLTDFPVLITLSSGVGRNNFDATVVFDELAEIIESPNGFNPSDSAASITVTSGSLVAYKNSGSGWAAIRSVDSRSSGKVYFEVSCDVIAGTRHMIGVGMSSESLTYPGNTAAGWGYHSLDGGKYNGGFIAYGNTYTQGDVIGVAINLDNYKIWWSKNGVWQAGGNPANDSTPAYANVAGPIFAMVGLYDVNDKVTLNLGTSSFQYTIPTGFVPFNMTYLDNTQKIAITDYTGINQLPVEIEDWNPYIESAYLWTKVPTVSSGIDTTIYLYYDSSQLDNDLWVGDTGDTPAKNVWDSGYKGVWHFNVDTDYLIDSTSSAHHGNVNNMDASNRVDETTWDFDGVNEYVQVPYTVDHAPTTALTVEALFYGDDFTGKSQLASKTQTGGWRLGIDNDGSYFNGIGGFIDLSGYKAVSIASAPYEDQWNYMAMAFLDQQYIHLTVNDSLVDIYDRGTTDTIDYTYNNSLILAGEAGNSTAPGTSAEYFDGRIKEIRISDVGRSDAWTKATYYSLWDNLLSLAESAMPVYTASGTTAVAGIPTPGIPVRLYRRSTGELVGSTISESGGTFTVDSMYDEDHYIVGLYTSSGTNALIFDWITP